MRPGLAELQQNSTAVIDTVTSNGISEMKREYEMNNVEKHLNRTNSMTSIFRALQSIIAYSPISITREFCLHEDGAPIVVVPLSQFSCAFAPTSSVFSSTFVAGYADRM